MEFQNNTSNVIKGDEPKEIELLTKDLKLSEDASTTSFSAPDDTAAPMSVLGYSAAIVSTQGDSGSTLSSQDDSIATMTAERKFYLFMTDLQKIAEESKDPTFEKMQAELLGELRIAHLKGKEIHELEIVQLLNRVERNVLMNEDSVRNFKELFGAMVSVLQYVMSAGTSHLSLENKNKVFENLMIVYQEIRYRIKWLNRVQSDFESFLQFSDKIGIPINFPHIKTAPVIAERLRTFIIAMKSFLEELEKYDGDVSTIIECLKEELLTKV